MLSVPIDSPGERTEPDRVKKLTLLPAPAAPRIVPLPASVPSSLTNSVSMVLASSFRVEPFSMPSTFALVMALCFSVRWVGWTNVCPMML
jgi:hypothetical protein